jgi:hypothetical protein
MMSTCKPSQRWGQSLDKSPALGEVPQLAGTSVQGGGDKGVAGRQKLLICPLDDGRQVDQNRRHQPVKENVYDTPKEEEITTPPKKQEITTPPGRSLWVVWLKAKASFMDSLRQSWMLFKLLCKGKTLMLGSVYLWLAGLSNAFEGATTLMPLLSSWIPSSLSDRLSMLDQILLAALFRAVFPPNILAMHAVWLDFLAKEALLWSFTIRKIAIPGLSLVTTIPRAHHSPSLRGVKLNIRHAQSPGST